MRIHKSPRITTRPRRATNRRGATTVEGALILLTLLMLLFAVLDLGLAALRYNVLAGMARSIARTAIVRGSAAPPDHAAWGPTAYVGTAAGTSEIAQAASVLLATMKPEEVAVNVTWPDGDNQENDRVRIHLSYQHQPLVPFLILGSSLNLQAECTMRVVH